MIPQNPHFNRGGDLMDGWMDGWMDGGSVCMFNIMFNMFSMFNMFNMCNISAALRTALKLSGALDGVDPGRRGRCLADGLHCCLIATFLSLRDVGHGTDATRAQRHSFC